MDDLHRRFRRLDRVAAPNLWHEAVGRAAELGHARRAALSPAFALVAAAMLTAALAGTLAVGAFRDDRLSPESTNTTYNNGVIVAPSDCGGIVALDPVSLEDRQLVADADDCESVRFSPMVALWSRDGSRMAYFGPSEAEEDSAGDPWIYEASTGEARRVGLCPATCDQAMFDISADGSLVAFVAISPSANVFTYDLVVLEVDSGEAHTVPLAARPGRPVFSPDGRRIAFPLLGGRSGVYVVDVGALPDGEVGTPWLLHGIVEASDLAWSPDGEWIAMTQSGGLGDLRPDGRPRDNAMLLPSGKGVVLVEADGGEARVVAPLPAQDHGARPTWSADSTSIAFVTTEREVEPDDGRLELWTVTIDGDEPRQIYEACCQNGFTAPTWSPDGEWIAFGIYGADEVDGSATYLVRPDGSGLRVVAHGLAGQHAWQPIPRD